MSTDHRKMISRTAHLSFLFLLNFTFLLLKCKKVSSFYTPSRSHFQSLRLHLCNDGPKSMKSIQNERIFWLSSKLSQILGVAVLLKPGDSVVAASKGYDAPYSLFSPDSSLPLIPLLAQSALLNSIPLRSELIGQMQAYLESFVQLINPSARQNKQLRCTHRQCTLNCMIKII